ncbi:regulator SirB [Spiribacter sp. C176]|uniref:Regulator SirB n=1 Tax=Spiribacter salilacus TaxID=2664894 RepID=A0A6N7QRJ9_9GAMM|nr:SirB2 family protein [Spiribacter salilacus]MRH78063.1 regulator SirB [Spiribacter salilacus]
MSYIALKHLHTTVVTLSLVLFLARSGWMVMNSSLLQKTWVRVLPHVVNTVLLVSALSVAWIGWQYPMVNHPWITAKVIALVLYIVFGVMVFKRDRSAGVRVGAFIGALAVYGYMVLVALSKSVVPF